LKVVDIDTTADKVDHILSAIVTVQKDWPIGKYKADLSLNGKQIGTFDYEVAADEGEEKE